MTAEEILDLIIEAGIFLDGCGNYLGDYNPKDEICELYIKFKNIECLACKAINNYKKEKP